MRMPEFINLTPENIANEHLCCIIRSRTKHPGVEAKRAWLRDRLAAGHVFRKLNARGTCFIEYAPLDAAWTPIAGDNYYYIYCLWVLPPFRGHGYARELLEYCIADARAHGASGVCMLGADRQRAWLSDQNFARANGFKTVDTTDNGYELLTLSFDGTMPHFPDAVKHPAINTDELTVFYDDQCPYMAQTIDMVREYCAAHNVPVHLHHVETLDAAKSLPCVFNNFAVFYGGKFQTVNLLTADALSRMLLG